MYWYLKDLFIKQNSVLYSMTRTVKKQTKTMQFIDNYLGRDQLIFWRDVNRIALWRYLATRRNLNCDAT